jgi:hypothetical protein
VDLLDFMIKWESGETTAEEEIQLFQGLVNSGMAWQLQGAYSRQAQALLNAGLIQSPFQVVADSGEQE